MPIHKQVGNIILGQAAVVVGIGVGMEGGAAGVQLLVEDDRVELALKVLGDA